MTGASAPKNDYMKIPRDNFYQNIEHWILHDFQSADSTEMREALLKLFEANGYRVFKMPEDYFGSYIKIEKEGNSTLVFMYKKSPNEKIDVNEIQHVKSAALFHKTNHAMVITNSAFTKAAKDLGHRSAMFLWDGQILKEALTKTFLDTSVSTHRLTEEEEISETDSYFEFKVIGVVPDHYLPESDAPITMVTLELTNISGRNLQVYINLPVLIRHDKKQYTATDWMEDGFSSGMIYQDAKVDLKFYFPESQLPELRQGDEVLISLSAPALDLQKTYPISLMPEDSRCFIVTYAFSRYSSPYWKAIWVRDNILLPSRPGRRLVSYYYRSSPRWIEHFKSYPVFLPFIRFAIKGILKFFPDRN